MSNIRQFLGGGIPVPPGANVQALDAPYNFSDANSGSEYLRAGALKAYSAAYAAAIAVAPQLRVFGSTAKSGGATSVGSSPAFYGYVSAKYVEVAGAAGQKYSSDLVSWTACTGSFTSANVLRPAVNGSSYMVLPAAAAATAPKYTSNGTTFTAVAGTFTTFPTQNACAYGNNWWITLSDLNGTAGGMGYINNANPAGTWTVAAAPALSGSTAGVKAIAFGGTGNWFVAVGTSSSNVAGKLATCTAPTAWTDRTTSSGIPFGASDTVMDVVFDGVAFVALSAQGIHYATDPTGAWTAGVMPLDTSGTTQAGAAAAMAPLHLATDGAGIVQLVCGAVDTANRRICYTSTDHGATWLPYQVYAPLLTSTAAYLRMSYANGKWLANFMAGAKGFVDVSTAAAGGAPDYVGLQWQACQGQFVRIK